MELALRQQGDSEEASSLDLHTNLSELNHLVLPFPWWDMLRVIWRWGVDEIQLMCLTNSLYQLLNSKVRRCRLSSVVISQWNRIEAYGVTSRLLPNEEKWVANDTTDQIQSCWNFFCVVCLMEICSLSCLWDLHGSLVPSLLQRFPTMQCYQLLTEERRTGEPLRQSKIRRKTRSAFRQQNFSCTLFRRRYLAVNYSSSIRLNIHFPVS